MTAAAILRELEQRGIQVIIDGPNTITLKPRRALDDDLLNRVRACKPAIIRALLQKPAVHDSNVRVALGFALNAIERHYPADCVTPDFWPLKWCQEAYPRQHRRITQDLPSTISRLMDEEAIGELLQALDEWVSLHLWVYEQFRPVALRRRSLSRQER